MPADRYVSRIGPIGCLIVDSLYGTLGVALATGVQLARIDKTEIGKQDDQVYNPAERIGSLYLKK